MLPTEIQGPFHINIDAQTSLNISVESGTKNKQASLQPLYFGRRGYKKQEKQAWGNRKPTKRQPSTHPAFCVRPIITDGTSTDLMVRTSRFFVLKLIADEPATVTPRLSCAANDRRKKP